MIVRALIRDESGTTTEVTAEHADYDTAYRGLPIPEGWQNIGVAVDR